MTGNYRSGRKSGRPLVLRPEVTLNLPGGRTIIVKPTIVQQSETGWFTFGDSECVYYEPLEHRFDVIVSRESFDIDGDDDDEATAGALWDELRAMCAIPDTSAARYPERARRNEDELWLAYLDVAELPAHMVAPDGNWAPIISAIGDLVDDTYGIIQDIRGGSHLDFAVSLTFGSLFVPKLLAVHPAARGQELGLRLLAHALWVLHRADGDVAVIQAAATENLFDESKPERTPESYARLVAYYARLGFRRWRPRRRPEAPGGSVMMLALGECGVRARFPSGAELWS